MTRKKLKLSFIPNESTRKITFNKRKKGFIKKMQELSILCDIDACAVVFNPFDSTNEMCPSEEAVKNTLEKFEMLTESEQTKKMVNHEGFLRQSVLKVMENNKKMAMEVKERKMKETMFQMLNGNGDKLNLSPKDWLDLFEYVNSYLKLLHQNEQTLRSQIVHQGESSSPANVGQDPNLNQNLNQDQNQNLNQDQNQNHNQTEVKN